MFTVSNGSQLLRDGQTVLCALASASENLPHNLVKSRVLVVWMQAVEDLEQDRTPKKCLPEELANAVARLGQMPRGDAMTLVRHVGRMCARLRTSSEMPDETDFLQDHQGILMQAGLVASDFY